MYMKKLLGIDLGSKKTGLARSDESGTLAFAWKTIEGSLETQRRTLENLILDQRSSSHTSSHFEEIIFGLPSQEGEWKNKIRSFALELKHALEKNGLNVPVAFANEDFSSFDAQKNLLEVKSTLKKKKRLAMDASKDDAEAARIMLQRYLDSRIS